jgi:hypothetical protein
MKLTLLTALLGVLLVAAAPAAVAAPPTAGVAGPVTGTCSFVDQATHQTVNGTIVNGLFTVTRFSASGGTLYATGTLTGTCTAVNSLGQTVTQAINTTVTSPVTGATGSCRILHLEVGPIDLDLLGLVVHTDRIVLDITAQSGSGNLLGNLLCAVANALNGGAPATQLADLLNRILAILG